MGLGLLCLGVLIFALFATQLAIWIALGLILFDIAVAHAMLGIVLDHPSDDVLGIQRNLVSKGDV